MFKTERTLPQFNWSMLGDIRLGRPNLGPTTDIVVYRLMQFTLRDALIRYIGVEKTDAIFFEAGMLSGREFHRNLLAKKDDINEFFDDLQRSLKELRMGIFRVEAADPDASRFTVTMAEDLDCSGLPVCREEICTYDEGFISGLLAEQTGRHFLVKEIDCWCSGDRVCRFDIRPAPLGGEEQ